MLADKPELKGYMIRKVILWPFYFITEKSPLQRLSETFFGHYGDPGCSYRGTLGLKNFLNDCVKGKDRYKQSDIVHLFWPVDSDSPIWDDFFRDKNQPLFGNIYFIATKGKYRLIKNISLSSRSSKQLSRYELNRSYTVSKEEFKIELLSVNVVKAKALFNQLFPEDTSQ